MIRVVPVQYYLEDYDQGKFSHLAFLDTVTDQFLLFSGSHVFDSWSDLVEAGASEEFLERIKAGCPEWFMVMEPAPPPTTADDGTDAAGGVAPTCNHQWRNVTGQPWLKCINCGVIRDDT